MERRKIIMPYFEVEFTGSIPEFGTVDLQAENEEEAKEIAIKEVEKTYPEYYDIEVVKVSEIKTDL
jgi:hypothetical protein